MEICGTAANSGLTLSASAVGVVFLMFSVCAILLGSICCALVGLICSPVFSEACLVGADAQAVRAKMLIKAIMEGKEK